MDPKNKYIVPKGQEITGALSISQIGTWLRCRKQWAYAYIEKIKPRIDRPAMSIGSMGHQAFAAAWLAKIAGADISKMIALGNIAIEDYYTEYLGRIAYLEEEELVFREQVDLAKVVFKRSLVAFNPDNWEPIVLPDGTPLVEVHFVVPCIGGKKMHGFIDFVGREISTGQVWQIDYKFQGSLGNESAEAFNIQNVVYQYALAKILERSGIDITGSMTYQCSNKASALPAILKNGKLSRAAINCSWESYLDHCISLGMDPEEYREEMQAKLSDVYFTLPVREFWNTVTVKRMWLDIIKGSAYEIAKKQKRYPRSMNKMNCNICGYSSLCQAELRDYDVDFIRNAHYITADKALLEVLNAADAAEEDKEIK